MHKIRKHKHLYFFDTYSHVYLYICQLTISSFSIAKSMSLKVNKDKV